MSFLNQAVKGQLLYVLKQTSQGASRQDDPGAFTLKLWSIGPESGISHFAENGQFAKSKANSSRC